MKPKRSFSNGAGPASSAFPGNPALPPEVAETQAGFWPLI